jgi:hypothetical protein
MSFIDPYGGTLSDPSAEAVNITAALFRTLEDGALYIYGGYNEGAAKTFVPGLATPTIGAVLVMGYTEESFCKPVIVPEIDAGYATTSLAFVIAAVMAIRTTPGVYRGRRTGVWGRG